jgi:hypothetical protein
MDVNVFISWSGQRSRELARILHNMLPGVIPGVKPYHSEIDMRAGVWPKELLEQLDRSKYGIFCVTPENCDNPWLHFEAGALARKNNGLSLHLLGLDAGDLRGPLAIYNARTVDEPGTRKLFADVNKALGRKAVSGERLKENFDVWWSAKDIASQFKQLQDTVVPGGTTRADQDKVIGQIIERLELLVKDRLNTKYIGKTPAYMKDICECLRAAQKKIAICSDYAPYCRFSDPDGYAVYRAILEEKAQRSDMNISMVILGDDLRRANNRSEVEADPIGSLKNYNDQKGTTITDVDELLQRLDREQTDLLNRDFAAVRKNIEPIDFPMSLYAWIADERQAVFSIPNFQQNATEHGFSTTDPILIEALEALQVRYRVLGRRARRVPLR